MTCAVCKENQGAEMHANHQQGIIPLEHGKTHQTKPLKQLHFTVKELVASKNIHPTLRHILKRFDKVLSQVEDWT